MPTSSARPANLESFASGSRGADGELRTDGASTKAAYAKFAETCTWGTLDAGSLLKGYEQYVGLNEEDARWVAEIAATFRAAGGSGGLVRLPDAAIAASLRRAGLSDERRSVTFDDPVAFGMPLTSGYANDPVNTGTGNFVEPETDLPFHGVVQGLSFGRIYNSRSDRAGAFGLGWSSWASARLRACRDGVDYEGPDGQRAFFPRMGAGYGRIVGVDALVQPLENGLALDWFGGRGRWEFDAAGRPVRIERGPGTEVRIEHDGEGRLVALTHAGGKRVDLEWEGERIAAAACSGGRRVVYRYDDLGFLVAAERDGGARSYEVDEEGRIVSVTDADGVVEVVNTYDDDGRVVEQLSPFGRRTSFTYLPGQVTVTSDVNDGPPNTYVHDLAGRVLAIVDGDEQQTSFNYDEWGNPVAISERSGAVTIQEWDDRARLTRRVLPTGASFSFAYDDLDRVVEVAASTGAVTRLSYSGAERSPAEIIDPEGGVTRLTVADGLVREAVDPDGVRLRFEFDPDGNIVATVDADGNVARLERDGAGRVIAAVTPLGRRTAFFYDDRGQLVERHDPSGAEWRYEYTAAGRLTRVIDPTGAAQEIRYGEHGCPTASVDALGHVTAQRYDVFGNVVGVVAPDGASWSYGYDALMRLTTIADPVGGTWRREYDANGNLVGSIDPVGTRCTATVDPAGQVTALDDGLTSSAFEFDELGRAVAHIRPDGTIARCEYDLCGRRTMILDPVGGVTRLEYTAGGKVRREVAPSGRVDELEYDRCGRIAARIDGAGRRWEHRYDADGALTERIEPTGDHARFTYDAGGRLSEWSAPGRGVTRYVYDEAGRATAITDRLAGKRLFDYDTGGHLVAATDANGATTRYAYNERGWVTEIVDPLGGVTARSYDASGRLVAETDPLGRVTTLTYDVAGRLVEHVDGSGRATQWSYDPSGRVRSFGPRGRDPITIQRDALGREIAIDEPGARPNRLRWDEAGRLAERSRGELVMRWRYTDNGERAALGYPDGTETAYSYDAGGFLAGQHHPTLGAIAFERDAAGRLVAATAEGLRARWRYDDGDLVEYEFEAGGRRRAAQLTRDPVGRVVAATIDGDPERFSYDLAGQMLSAETPSGLFSFSYDANGRLACETSRAGTATYEYDAAGQLLARRGASAITKYEYDSAGRRIRETDDDFSRTWRWDELGRLARIESSGPGTDGERTTIVTVDALGELAEVDGTPLLWDTADAYSPLAWMDERAVIGHGAPWALVGDSTAEWLAPDWQGTIGDSARDPWGTAMNGSGAGSGLQLGYRGELEFDGQVWLRNRAYQPASRSFLQPDPLPALPGTAWAGNTYHYAGNNPVGLSDPRGLRPITDAELQEHRDRMNRNIFEKGWDWAAEHKEYILAGAMVVAGGALMVFGGPVGVVLGGGLMNAGVDIAVQKFTTGEVNIGQVLVAGATGALAGGAGLAAGAAIKGTSMVASVGRGAVSGGVENVVGGAINRGIHGQNAFDPGGMAKDLLTGAAPGAIGGRLGAGRLPSHADETARLTARADELKSVMDPIAQKQRTVAVLGTDEGVDVLGAGAKRDLDPAQRALARDGEVTAKLKDAHAEETVLHEASQRGLTPRDIGTSRDICGPCQAMLEDAGATITGPRSASWL
ncbi:MAG: hypothetical protein QOK16_3578 [Solirubrobacteraceae bacterium]|nr:hypothetical protein [Solirubrobacteraceae bacterium]